MRIRIACLLCENPITVDVGVGSRPTRHDPGSPPEILDIEAPCGHGDELADEVDFYEACLEAADEATERAWEREMDRRAHRDMEERD